jgi:hypothetical protein
MKRNIIAVICLILAATFIFAACTKKNPIYTDIEGKTHIAYTDENGETVTNEYGDIVVVPTDESGNLITEENGELLTQTVEHRKIDVNGKKVETVAYSMTVPEGWVLNSELDSYAQFKPDKDGSTVTMDINYSPYSYDEALKSAENLIKYFNENVPTVIENGKEEITIKNGDGEISPVTKFYFLGETKADDGSTVRAGLYYYVFTAGKFTYTIPCGAKTEEEYRNTDFEAVLSSITYK